MSDDWGCFNADIDVIKGLVYPKIKAINLKTIEKLAQEYIENGLLLRWLDDNARVWGYFVRWESHNYCNTTSLNLDGKQARHKRKTPLPPKDELNQYLNEKLERLRAVQNKYRIPNPNPNPNPNPIYSRFLEIWRKYPNKDGKDRASKKFRATVKTENDWTDINKALDNYLKSERVQNGYVKNGSTWFGNWRDWIDWEDSGSQKKDEPYFSDELLKKLEMEREELK